MKYIDAARLRAKIEQLLEFDGTVKTDYYIGKRDAELVILSFLDSLQQEQPEVDLEKEIETYFKGWYMDETDQGYILHTPDDRAGLMSVKQVARHFAEWGARHSINWGDVQLLDTFILELSREEKDGTDWGDSEKFYTEVLRRFHEFNDKKISEIVAEWGAEHLKR